MYSQQKRSKELNKVLTYLLKELSGWSCDDTGGLADSEKVFGVVNGQQPNLYPHDSFLLKPAPGVRFTCTA